jgi:CRP-like cAMP-binding protein
MIDEAFDTSTIDSYVQHCLPFSDEEIKIFHSLLQYKIVKKKSFLLQQGEVCEFEAFIKKGCIKTYYIDDKGLEVILYFAIENWWIGDIESFVSQASSALFIEALEDSEIFYINYSNKEKLFKEVPKFERMFRLMTQRALSVIQHRLIDTISKTTDERYLNFLKRYPQIPQRVAQHQIASYLGVTPEFLSKIRAKLAKHDI